MGNFKVGGLHDVGNMGCPKGLYIGTEVMDEGHTIKMVYLFYEDITSFEDRWGKSGRSAGTADRLTCPFA